MVKPLKKEFSIILRKLSYTVLLLSTLFFVRCGSSDAVDSLDALGTLDSKETDALLNKITLNNEHIKEENLNNEISLYLGEKLVFNIPHATELFDADQNDNTQIKAKITNQEDKTLVTFVIEGNTLTIDPRKIGTGTFTLAYTTSYNNLGIVINNKIKKIISDSFTKKINYKIIQNLNMITVPKKFPKIISITQHIEKTTTLPAVMDRFRKLVLPEILLEISPMENAPKLNLLGNILSITSSTIGNNTITLKYKTLEKVHTDERLYISTTQTLDIIIITYAQENTITIPANISTTFTVTQNVPKTLTLPTVTDSFNTAIVPTVNDPVATLNGNNLIITSPTIGTKTITLTYTSQTINGKAATIQTASILLTTVAPVQNTITIPANISTTFTVTQNVAKTLTLPTVTDSFNTAIVPTVNDPVATLNGNALIITSPTIGTKTITLTYTSQAINGKIATTQTANIRLTTIPANSLKNELKIVHNKYIKTPQISPFKGDYPIIAYVGPNQTNTVEIITFQDVAGVDVIPTFFVGGVMIRSYLSYNGLPISINLVKDEMVEGQTYYKYRVDFQRLIGTIDQEVLIDIIWTTQAKTHNGIRYSLVDSYTNSIKVKITNQLAKTYTYQNDIIRVENGVTKTFTERDGEVIQVFLEPNKSINLPTISKTQALVLLSTIEPTMTLNNEGNKGVQFTYNHRIDSSLPIGINVLLGYNSTSTANGVIKLVYTSKRVVRNWEDIDNDGKLDNVIYTPVTVTLYIEVNGAKKDEATFPSSN